MNILILGSGGREHAFAEALCRSENCDKIFVAPGNAGTNAKFVNIELDLTDFESIAKFASEFGIMMIIVGPEAPLAAGIADYFQKFDYLQNIFVVGPNQHAAQLESSKHFAKEFMQRHNIPTARYKAFTTETLEEGITYLENHPEPIVLKADGLAAGKGVLIVPTRAEAQKELRDMLQGAKFGAAGQKVVIEEFLDGIELSVFVLTDGKEYVLLPEAKDYKRIGEEDTGLNTGGMGAISPVPFADEAFMQRVKQQVIEPTISGLQKDNIAYTGFIFFGLIKVGDNPFVIEYNVRMGDPETEAVLPRIKSDFFELLLCLHDHRLSDYQMEFDERAAATVVLVSGGYPGDFEKGKEITGIEKANAIDGVHVYHSGTKTSDDGAILSAGGRVLAVTALGGSLQQAVAKANEAAGKINFDGKYNRTDIGYEFRN